MVNVIPYFLAQTIISLPWAIITPALFSIPFYFMVDLRPGWQYFLWFYLIITVTSVSN